MKFFQKNLSRILFLLSFVFVIFIADRVFAGPPVETPVANIVVATKNNGDYEMGDVVVAMNAKSTLFIQAEQLTHPKKMPRKANGTIQQGTILEDFYEKTREYKFERISPTEVRRTRRFISDASTDPITYTSVNEVDVLSNVPNQKGEFIDVSLFIQKNKSIVFGNEGSEYWYGGETKITDESMDDVWNDLEKKTNQKRNYDFNWSPQEKKSFAILKVPDMTDKEVKDLTAPELDANGKVLKERKEKIDLNAVLDVSQKSTLTNKSVEHDFRGATVDIKSVIIVK